MQKASIGLQESGCPPLTLRCLFIEKDPNAFASLQAKITSTPEVAVSTLNGEFETLVPDVMTFCSKGPRPFSFVLIDPTGWTGYGLQAITPILRRSPGEVLINFMTKDIKRFIDDEDSTATPTFVDLYGDDRYRAQWRGLSGIDREDAIVDAYCERVAKAGGFEHVVSAVVWHPTDKRTHYHLIYATRNDEGLRTFRDVERKAMREQQDVSDRKRQQRRVESTGQTEMFGGEVLGSHYLDELTDRYHAQARAHVENLLRSRGRILLSELEVAALKRPMTWTQTLKGWLAEWVKAGGVRYEGLGEKERVPKNDQQHFVVWSGRP
jgi:three-Cys-motif partner protein